jgi:hypothetical protein
MNGSRGTGRHRETQTRETGGGGMREAVPRLARTLELSHDWRVGLKYAAEAALRDRLLALSDDDLAQMLCAPVGIKLDA